MLFDATVFIDFFGVFVSLRHEARSTSRRVEDEITFAGKLSASSVEELAKTLYK